MTVANPMEPIDQITLIPVTCTNVSDPSCVTGTPIPDTTPKVCDPTHIRGISLPIDHRPIDPFVNSTD